MTGRVLSFDQACVYNIYIYIQGEIYNHSAQARGPTLPSHKAPDGPFTIGPAFGNGVACSVVVEVVVVVVVVVVGLIPGGSGGLIPERWWRWWGG